MTKFAQIKMGYQRGKLVQNQMMPQPLDQFSLWMNEAVSAGCSMPNAFTLATVSAEGKAQMRIVLLMKFDAQGMVFFTNYQSAKAQDLAVHPHASMLFFWPDMERQVRICGPVQKTSAEESDAYFATRPREAQIAAIASPQSQVIPDYGFLTRKADELGQKYSGHQQVIRPDNWGGFRLTPENFEFWQGGPHRLHDRIFYRPNAEHQWLTERLAP